MQKFKKHLEDYETHNCVGQDLLLQVGLDEDPDEELLEHQRPVADVTNVPGQRAITIVQFGIDVDLVVLVHKVLTGEEEGTKQCDYWRDQTVH